MTELLRLQIDNQRKTVVRFEDGSEGLSQDLLYLIF